MPRRCAKLWTPSKGGQCSFLWRAEHQIRSLAVRVQIDCFPAGCRDRGRSHSFALAKLGELQTTNEKGRPFCRPFGPLNLLLRFAERLHPGEARFGRAVPQAYAQAPAFVPRILAANLSIASRKCARLGEQRFKIAALLFVSHPTAERLGAQLFRSYDFHDASRGDVKSTYLVGGFGRIADFRIVRDSA